MVAARRAIRCDRSTSGDVVMTQVRVDACDVCHTEISGLSRQHSAFAASLRACRAGRAHRCAPFQYARVRNSPANSTWVIVRTMKIQCRGNFACKDKDVRRERRQITMNINADNNGRGRGQRPLLACKSCSRRDAAQNKARRGRPPGHTNSVSISRIDGFGYDVNNKVPKLI